MSEQQVPAGFRVSKSTASAVPEQMLCLGPLAVQLHTPPDCSVRSRLQELFKRDAQRHNSKMQGKRYK